MPSRLRFTVNQLIDICKKHPYIILRDSQGQQMAFNSKVVPFARKKWPTDGSNETAFVSYRPCSFNEYISRKIPFVDAKTQHNNRYTKQVCQHPNQERIDYGTGICKDCKKMLLSSE